MCDLIRLHSMGILLVYCLNCNKDCNSSSPIESSVNSQKKKAKQSVDSDPKLRPRYLTRARQFRQIIFTFQLR
jgi:hypothetical protein